MCVHNYVIDVHILSFISLQNNIALMLHSCKEYALSVSYLEHALKLNTKYVDSPYVVLIVMVTHRYHGDGSIQVALKYGIIVVMTTCYYSNLYT